MDITIYTYTNKGGKDNNEDYIDYYIDENRGAFILADGLGGHDYGEVASKLVVKTLLEKLKNAPNPDIEYMKDIFQNTNDILIENQKIQNYINMKTTAVALSICGNEAIWGHLGDSRLYYFSDNKLEKVTKDHSVTYKKYLSGEILFEDINSDDDRSSLLGAFGNQEKFCPEFIKIPQMLKKGDAFLLCSDGFWEYVFDDEMYIDFLKSDTPKQWVDFMVLRHIKKAEPSNDNFSLMAIMLEE